MVAGEFNVVKDSRNSGIYPMPLSAYGRVVHGADQPKGYHGAVFKKWGQPCEYPCGERYKTVSERRDVENQFLQRRGNECVRRDTVTVADKRNYGQRTYDAAVVRYDADGTLV